MKIIKGFKLGGLQQKIFNLMLLVIVALIVAFIVVTVSQQKNLTNTVQDAAEAQQSSITEVSEATMRSVLESSMVRMTSLQTYIADELFSEVRANIMTLKAFAEELFANRDSFSDHPYYPPIPYKNGIPSVQMLHEEGVDPSDSEDFGLIANMSEVMLSMYKSSDRLSSCFVADTYGNILFANDRSGAYIDERGRIPNLPVREREWYVQAVEAGELIFTGVVSDAFTNIPGVVCAVPVYFKGKLVAVIGADVFLTSVDEYIKSTAQNGGFLCLINEQGQVIFSPKEDGTFKPELSDDAPDLRKSDNTELADFISAALENNTGLTEITVDGMEYYMSGAPLGTVGWAGISAVEKEITRQPTEAMLTAYNEISQDAVDSFQTEAGRAARTFVILMVIIILLAIIATLLLAKRIVRPIEHMTDQINGLSGSEAVFKMNDVYRTKDEIEVLAESFASISEKARSYITQITEITAEKERINTEFALATRIQADMLPHIYPAFPDRSEFDVYATMTPAKEVGGDFYDFFLIDDDHLALVIADVSGKGVPAALFMMVSKILLGNNAVSGKSPAQILENVNDQICSNNREEMFVTVWVGILTISTGKLVAANAGHEYPIIKKGDGSFELFRDPHGFVIGGMPGMKYKEYEISLEKGDTLFVYTDGAPEASDADNELFGTDRMLNCLNRDPEADPETLLGNMKDDIDAFVKDAPQFDDLTMLALKLMR